MHLGVCRTFDEGLILWWPALSGLDGPDLLRRDNVRQWPYDAVPNERSLPPIAFSGTLFSYDRF